MSFGQVVAIVGDADVYHVDCAKALYGAEAVEQVVSGAGVDAAAGIGPKDREGNVLGVVLSGDPDIWDSVTGLAWGCGKCHGYIED